MKLNSIEEIIEDIRQGRMVILMDDEDRENEGDLVMAASLVRPEDINFMATEGRGLICLTLTKERCQQLNLDPMVQANESVYGTNFTVSIEAAEGVTTGISAADRARTIQAAVAPQAMPKDIVQPGHIFPIMAQPGGVLSRAGHTEAGCDLARLAGLESAAVIVEIMNEDGSMARRPDLEAFAEKHALKIGTIEDLIHYRLTNETTVECIKVREVETDYGPFQLRTYHDVARDQYHHAFVVGTFDDGEPVLTRVHLPTPLRDLFGLIIPGKQRSSRWTIHTAMRRVADEGRGVVVTLGFGMPEADQVETQLDQFYGEGESIPVNANAQIMQMAQTGDYLAIIALGCVIRGGTPHFEFVSAGATEGLNRVQLDTGVPVTFGVLTVDDVEQAIERSGEDPNNKGEEAALTALEMAREMLLQSLYQWEVAGQDVNAIEAQFYAENNMDKVEAMSLNEFQLISEYFKYDYSDESLLLGIGDDAAIIQPPAGHRLAVSSDTLVEAVHFPKGARADLIARRALRVNLSDMAAMAAQPRWFSLALTLPAVDTDWLQAFSTALHEDARRFGCTLVGGDTTQGSLNIGVQIMGTIADDAPALQRSGAQSGDLLVVTGTLGDAAAALDYLDEADADVNPLSQRYWLPEPRVEFAQRAASLIHAACDISDGLVADLGHICKASGLGAEIKTAALPLSEAIQRYSGESAMQKALVGGDDYELCMAVPPQHLGALTEISEELGVPVTVVGMFQEGESVSCVDEQGQQLMMAHSGYQHF
eukprot:g4271.t1